jgi:hypothetical protein
MLQPSAGFPDPALTELFAQVVPRTTTSAAGSAPSSGSSSAPATSRSASSQSGGSNSTTSSHAGGIAGGVVGGVVGLALIAGLVSFFLRHRRRRQQRGWTSSPIDSTGHRRTELDGGDSHRRQYAWQKDQRGPQEVDGGYLGVEADARGKPIQEMAG